MVKFTAALAMFVLAACDTARYEQTISFPTHGTAVRTNMAAHIIDPRPPSPRPVPVDVARTLTALERYRTDDVKVPNAIQTSPSVATAEDTDE